MVSARALSTVVCCAAFRCVALLILCLQYLSRSSVDVQKTKTECLPCVCASIWPACGLQFASDLISFPYDLVLPLFWRERTTICVTVSLTAYAVYLLFAFLSGFGHTCTHTPDEKTFDTIYCAIECVCKLNRIRLKRTWAFFVYTLCHVSISMGIISSLFHAFALCVFVGVALFMSLMLHCSAMQVHRNLNWSTSWMASQYWPMQVRKIWKCAQRMQSNREVIVSLGPMECCCDCIEFLFFEKRCSRPQLNELH